MADRFDASLAELTDPVLSVGGLSAYLGALLEEDPYLCRLWVNAEVSSCSCNRNGHWFLTLRDPDTGDALNGVIWQGQARRLRFLPEVGQQVLALGQVRAYSRGSTYQLQIWQVLPAGEGLLALRYQQLRARLQAEGLFERKRPLPSHPSCVGVVSSPQAAGWGDIQRTLRGRYPGLQVVFAPAIVQGDQAPVSLVRAIRQVEQDGRAEVLLLARGGGAAEDLWGFNDERVVRAVAECAIPVVTGIGHQRDETLADLAADYAAHTPTAAAERVVPALADLEQQRQLLAEALAARSRSALGVAAERLGSLRQRLLGLGLPEQIAWQQERQLADRLLRAMRYRLQQVEQHQQSLGQQLQALDPQAVLRRGYALVRTESGSWVRSGRVAAGSRLRLELADGSLWVRVERHDP